MITWKRFKHWLICIAFFACLFCLSTDAAWAASPFFWDSIDVDMILETDGDLLVTETQKYVFTQLHTNERYRSILLNGINRITDVAVYENNEPLSIDTGKQNNHFWIRWHHELTEPSTHTFVVKYRVIGGVQVKDEQSQIDWNAIFPKRSAAINHGKVTVHVPETFAGKSISFHGEGVGSRDRRLDAVTFEFVPKGPLKPQQYFNIRLGFPSNSLAIAQTPTSYWTQAKSSSISTLQWAIPSSIIILIMSVSIVARKRCPNCGKLTLKRSSQIVQAASTQSSGERNVIHSCQHCNYERTFNKIIPRKSSSSSSSSWIGSGCSSSGCGGGGCGGGGCGGGG